MDENPFRQLPSVNEVLDVPCVRALLGDHSHQVIVAAIRQELHDLRRQVRQGEAVSGNGDVTAIGARVQEQLQRELRSRLRPVINATGIILHTNLGRAPLAEEAATAVFEAARGYLNLEMDLETGKHLAPVGHPRMDLPAHRGGVGHRRQQQRGCHRDRPPHPVPGKGNHRFTRPIDRDRR